MTGHLAEELEAFVDGELDAADRREAELHLASCAVCTQRVASRRALSSALRGSLPRFRAPAAMRVPVAPIRAQAPRLWPGLAAAVALIAVAAIGGFNAGRRQADASAMRDAIVSSHVRSLLATHLTDVASSDRHTVKPWFTGVLDFAPTVVDPSAQGFPLLGGRLDYIAGRRVPALVYGRNRHVINLFQWPTPRSDAPMTTAVDNGYNILHWIAHRTEYWMVSDLNDAELRQCATLIQAAPSG
jgi:anti-sigma factor RsiW